MRIHVLALDGVFDTGLAAILDTFATANELAAASRTPSMCFEVRTVGVRRRVRTGQGLGVPAVLATGLPRPDVIVMPGLGAKTPEMLQVALERRDVADAVSLLRRHAAAGTRVAAACSATFVLAEASLLDGQTATTTWWLAPLFRKRYPRVELDESRMVAANSLCVTAGAALAHLDLALWLVRQHSPDLAALTARYLVVDPRPSQAAYVIPDHLAHEDPIVVRFERWARLQLAEGFSLGAAARAVGASERTLARRLRSVLDRSPLSYFQDLRVERAVHLLQTSSASIDEIASQVGYSDGVTLRTLLRRKLGRGVRELRANTRVGA
ncbi:GlxA family transcriptional regulator [Stigmatella aurantiaca]|nr:helix-turn-helix domain-containing protein [Stigmatella aurantiaca]